MPEDSGVSRGSWNMPGNPVRAFLCNLTRKHILMPDVPLEKSKGVDNVNTDVAARTTIAQLMERGGTGTSTQYGERRAACSCDRKELTGSWPADHASGTVPGKRVWHAQTSKWNFQISSDHRYHPAGDQRPPDRLLQGEREPGTHNSALRGFGTTCRSTKHAIGSL